MRGRAYTVSFDNLAVPATNVIDLFEITAGDDKPVAICGITLGPVGGVADVGDAAEEHLRCVIRRGYTTSGSVGAAPVPVPVNPGSAAATFTAKTGNTTVATVGTIVDLFPFGWNMRTEYEKWFAEPFELVVAQATLLVVRMLTGPADALAVSGTLFCEEVG